MTDDIRSQAITLYDRFTHEGMERREFMARMTRLAGSLAAANALIGTIAASPAAAALTDPADKRLVIRKGPLGFGSPLSGYVAAPKGAKKVPVVMVIHENRGLNAHIEDVARRLALAGYFTVAPDLLSPVGGTPANEDAARDAIGKLDLAKSVASVVALGDGLKKEDHSNGKLGVVGFCWGGAFVNRLAVAAGDRLSAGVAYYGPAPDPSEAVKVKAPLLLHYAGLDDRVYATGRPWVAALKKAGKSVTVFDYPGANHAFNNDTSAERYNKTAADLAWKRTLAFFAKRLK
ncbi:MAG TPA: dienelactone hydrolase family protein [Sphingomicrobium sp.]|nr:dienelactone hydrolase family protein [Sphingomicrobium sp.]